MKIIAPAALALLLLPLAACSRAGAAHTAARSATPSSSQAATESAAQPGAPPVPLHYPPARRDDTADAYFGTRVPAPYQ
ncbi:MAG: hypothetical protein ACRETB_11735, partial [Steroidobacteraceae bacterium]